MLNNYNTKYITSKKNQQLREIAGLQDKKNRDRYGLYSADGIKLTLEALKSGRVVKNIIISENRLDILTTQPLRALAERYIETENFFICLNEDIFSSLTSEVSPEGIICLIEKPAETEKLSFSKPILVLDSIQDAGNLGTIIRTAHALAGIDIVLTGDCADIYSPKTIRASMGATFRQNIVRLDDIIILLKDLKNSGYTIIATALRKDAVRIGDIDFAKKTALIFGNEGGGLGNDIISRCDICSVIPLNADSESLNVGVAAAIYIYELSKKK